MIKISQLPIVKQVDADFPNGAIINETDTNDGTPVVREIYNDILVNLYKVLELSGVDADGTEDKEGKYQLLEAIRKLPNLLNDTEQVLSLSGTVWSINLNIDTLPNKYVFIARASADYISGTFKGTSATTYSFTSTGFSEADELLVIIDQSQVRAISLTSMEAPLLNEVFTVFGIPVSYNDSNDMLYNEQGVLLSDAPSSGYLEDAIQEYMEDESILITDIFVYNGYVLCVVYIPGDIAYKFFQVPLNDLGTVTPVTVVGDSVGFGFDYMVYFYSDGGKLYMTNQSNNSNDDSILSSYNYDPVSETITKIADITLIDFQKTSNAAVKAGSLYTLVNGVYTKFDLLSGSSVVLGSFNGNNGNLFSFGGYIYYTVGEVAKKWL